jgi:hypothetical protein
LKKPIPIVGGGYLNEKTELGSFANKGDERIKLCHTRFLVDKKQNISFSFDLESMKCFSCGGGGHDVSQEGGGGGGGGSAFFSPTKTFWLHCLASKGNARKSFELRTGLSLSWCSAGSTSQKRGKEIPAGSVLVISSATHLLMEGLSGYVADLIKELKKID